MDEDGNKLPDRGVYHGNSMGDMFRDGDTLIFSDVPFDKLECDDIVAIFERSPYFVHRIVKKENGIAVTMGDNNFTPDDLVELNPNSKLKSVCNYIPVKSLGALLAVAGGAAGMEQFRRRQKHLRLRLRIAGILPLHQLGRLRLPAKNEIGFRDGTGPEEFRRYPRGRPKPGGKNKISGWMEAPVLPYPERNRSQTRGHYPQIGISLLRRNEKRQRLHGRELEMNNATMLSLRFENNRTVKANKTKNRPFTSLTY
jgi:hypothetical protein